MLASRGCRVVILDNFEQLIPRAIAPVHDWLCSSPGTTFLITSRRMLHLRGERVFEVPPLDLPLPDNVAQTSDATQLFVDRATATEPAFDTGERAPIDELVRYLEGIPLALELAAGQMRHLRPGELLRRLRDTTRFALETEEREVDPRHASLKTALESSWRLLEPFERSALSQLATCRHGFTLDAAEAIVDLSDFSAAPPVRSIVAALREATLLRVDDRVRAPEPVRWDMYESVREFASMLPSGAAKARHAVHYLSRAKRWVDTHRTLERDPRGALPSRELANLHAAFEYFSRSGDTSDRERSAELALVMHEIHRLSQPALAIFHLTAALDHVENHDLRMRLHTARGVCHRRTGDTESAHADFRRARACGEADPIQGAHLDVEEAVLVLQAGVYRSTFLEGRRFTRTYPLEPSGSRHADISRPKSRESGSDLSRPCVDANAPRL